MFCRAVVSCSTGTVAVTSPMELAASPSQHGLLCIPGARALVKPMSSSSTAAIANSKKKRKKEKTPILTLISPPEGSASFLILSSRQREFEPCCKTV